jgi:hypothetical protein
LTASYWDEEPKRMLEELARGWQYAARTEITASDLLRVVTAKGETVELTPGGGRFGLALHARMASDNSPARDPREHHLLGLWPIKPTVFWSRFELPRVRPAESGPSGISVAMLTAMFREGVTPLVRTDFSDDAAWNRVVSAVTQPTDFGDSGAELDRYTPNSGRAAGHSRRRRTRR